MRYLLFAAHRFLIFILMLLILPAVVFALVDFGDFQIAPGQVAEKPSYSEWVGDVLSGDFGTSLRARRPIDDLIADYLPASLELLLPALVLSLNIGILLGFCAAAFPRTIPDSGLRLLSLLATSLPIVWVGLLLVWVVGIRQEWLPLGGRCPPRLGECQFSDRVDYMIMPITSLTVFGVGTVTLFIRNFVLDLKSASTDEKPTKLAWLGGIFLAPLLALPGLLANLLAALVLVESVFSYPGLGRLFVAALISRDFPVVLAVAYLATLTLVLCYFIFTMLYNVMAAMLSIKPDGYIVTTNYQLEALAEQQSFSTPRSIAPRPKSLPLLGTILAGIAGVILLVIVVVCLTVSTDSAYDTTPGNQMLPLGSEGHPLGTDVLGRDFQARLLFGGRESLKIAFLAALISLAVGVLPGLIGGAIDGLLGNLINMPMNAVLNLLNGIPFLLLILLIRSNAETGTSVTSYILTLGLLGWGGVPPFTRAWLRYVRRGKLYTVSPETSQGGWGHVFLSFGMLLGFLLASQTAFMLLMEVSLGFLGVGLRPPTPTLGVLLVDSTRALARSSHLINLPGGLISVLVLCLALIALRLRSALNVTAPDLGM